jgi:type II secretory pathway pseudopilin PulG
VVGERGFTYLSALFFLAVLSGGLALAGEEWQTTAAREKEAELLQIGGEYRKAIERYYLLGARVYPRSLGDLLKDPRQPGTVRHLRRLYPDPLTPSGEWGLLKAPDGGIAGVFSLSSNRPFKASGFGIRDRAFEGAKMYSDWKFTYEPAGAKPVLRVELPASRP